MQPGVHGVPDLAVPDGRRAGLSAAAALQHARPDLARPVPGQAHDGQGDDHRPRPHERGRAQLDARPASRRAATAGVVSSHSWSTPDAYRRILQARRRRHADRRAAPRRWSRTGRRSRPSATRPTTTASAGARTSTASTSSAARAPAPTKNPVVYPFKSWDGKQTISKLTTGQHTWDVNTDGIANYGLFPDWLEDIRKVGGNGIVKDFGRGAEAYLEMWERAVGVPGHRPVPSRSMFTTQGPVPGPARRAATRRCCARPASPRCAARSCGATASRSGRSATARSTPCSAPTGRADARSPPRAPSTPAQGVNVGDDAQAIGGALHLGTPHRAWPPRAAKAAYVYGVNRRQGRLHRRDVPARHGAAPTPSPAAPGLGARPGCGPGRKTEAPAGDRPVMDRHELHTSQDLCRKTAWVASTLPTTGLAAALADGAWRGWGRGPRSSGRSARR